jgi:hypothetical protein
MTGSDCDLGYYSVAAGRNSIPPSEQAPFFQWLDRHLPGIAAYTGIKSTLVSLGIVDSVSHARREYLARSEYVRQMGFEGKDPIFEVALPVYVDALQSIKRDFRGIPVVVIFQSIDWRQAYPFMDKEYLEFTDRTQESLKNYYNSNWQFFNMHKLWKEKNLFKEAELFYGLHLPSHLQKLVAEYVSEKINKELIKKQNLQR